MAFVVVSIAALIVSALTLFSGFGLGPLLMPVFALFCPIEVAVAATAVVHGANNVVKVAVFGRSADWKVVARFAVPAVLCAFVGAASLGLLADVPALARYGVGGREAVVTPLKLVMAALMTGFACFELVPGLTLAVEPMITLGRPAVEFANAARWTVVTKDRSYAAHFEHTVAVTADGISVLTDGQ